VHTAIPFQGGELEARLTGELWTVRLGELEASSKWLDFALAELLDDDTRRAHEVATKLIEQMLVDQVEYRSATE
jgi:hypothetical protein